ncbi:MAG: hypothetical protein BWY15_00068 [Firmicutes bacterium ADurb.Bin193]|nr:MAG: hypothetical protein BWY15_00068 [Firmicutes bacterium ADurb.Bin193]
MIYIITGHYGSGKTEIALNLALSLTNPIIIDLDIVNPYFRTKDAQKMLVREGIRLIAPEFANTNVNMPTLPPEIFGALESENDVVIDVGGDDDGAIALGQYHKYFEDKPYKMYFVINKRRPLTSNSQDTIRLMRDIEGASRLKVTGIINNTNVKGETTAADILDGQRLADEISQITGIPVLAVSGIRSILADLKTDIKKMPLDLYLTLPWERGV